MRRFLVITVTWLLLGPGMAVAQEENSCLNCHEVDPAEFASTPHGDTPCLDCHVGADSARHRRGMDPVDCAACHADLAAEQAQSQHGRSTLAGTEGIELPTCTTCHGSMHSLTPVTDPSSPVYLSNQPETCATCHGGGQPAPPGVKTLRPISAYTSSVHAAALAQGVHGAACSDCHSAHSTLPSEDPASRINRANVPATCGACHTEIRDQFDKSIHGLAAAAGVSDSPVCTDCHGEHHILAVTDEGSPASATNVPIILCGSCHSDLRLGEKYDIPGSQVPSYSASFHGLAARGGVQTVANCASCHGVHNILPSSDPNSTIYPDNLPTTCGQCHQGAGTRFAIGPIHVLADTTPNVVAYWIRAIYIPMIWAVVIFMLAHNLLDLAKKTRNPEPCLRRRPPEDREIMQRLSRPFRLTHGLAAISFIFLVFSGFALKYPESWWAGMLQLGGEHAAVRGLMHRTAAIGLMAALVIHLVHVAISRDARRSIGALLPRPADIKEFFHRVGYNLGRRADPPAAVRVGYIEKLEYWAALWGTLITAGTGLLLWFENWTLTNLPGWVPEAATVLHFLEAVLATLAILIWHFYSVMFDPAVYPIDMTWLTGKPPYARAVERGEVITKGSNDQPAE